MEKLRLPIEMLNEGQRVCVQCGTESFGPTEILDISPEESTSLFVVTTTCDFSTPRHGSRTLLARVNGERTPQFFLRGGVPDEMNDYHEANVTAPGKRLISMIA